MDIDANNATTELSLLLRTDYTNRLSDRVEKSGFVRKKEDDDRIFSEIDNILLSNPSDLKMALNLVKRTSYSSRRIKYIYQIYSKAESNNLQIIIDLCNMETKKFSMDLDVAIKCIRTIIDSFNGKFDDRDVDRVIFEVNNLKLKSAEIDYLLYKLYEQSKNNDFVLYIVLKIDQSVTREDESKEQTGNQNNNQHRGNRRNN